VGLKRSRNGATAFDIANYALMAFICFITLYPVWYVVVNSLNDSMDAMRGGIYWWPRQFSLDSYAAVFLNGGIRTAFAVTIAKTIVGTAVSVFFTAMVAYSFSRRDLVGRRSYMTFGMITMFFGGGLIPTYLLIRNIGLLDHFLVYVIPAMFSFFNLIIMATFFKELPEALEEAARIDGANDLLLFVRIVLPVSMPVIATIALYNGVGQWNDYFTGMIYINNPELQPIQTYLYRVIAGSGSNQMAASAAGVVAQTVTSQSIKLATMVVTTLPIVLAYPFLQKYFVKGLMIGSIKG
jgi:putative aldouronate transport system permease protein